MESTLTYSFEDLYKDVGEYAGLGRSPTGEDLATVKRRTNDGYRAFLGAHSWNFLKQSSILPIKTSWQVPLPDNFESMKTSFKYSPTDGGGEMEETDESTILAMRSGSNSTTGRPVKFAIRPSKYSTAETVKWEAIFFPAPGGAYELHYSYWIVVNKLVETDDKPICGAEHSQALRAYCLAEVEAFDDEIEGVWTKKLPFLLLDSIKKDGKKAARSVGVMGSKEIGYDRIVSVTYENVQY